MIYVLNENQKEIVKTALATNSHIRVINDLKREGFYEPLVAAGTPPIPETAVTREIAYLRCDAQNADQFAEFRRTNDYARFATWATGEIEMMARFSWLEMLSFKDQNLMRIFQLIENLARIAREKASRRVSDGGNGGPGSDREFRKAMATALRFLKIEPDDQ